MYRARPRAASGSNWCQAEPGLRQLLGEQFPAPGGLAGPGSGGGAATRVATVRDSERSQLHMQKPFFFFLPVLSPYLGCSHPACCTPSAHTPPTCVSASAAPLSPSVCPSCSPPLARTVGSSGLHGQQPRGCLKLRRSSLPLGRRSLLPGGGVSWLPAPFCQLWPRGPSSALAERIKPASDFRWNSSLPLGNVTFVLCVHVLEKKLRFLPGKEMPEKEGKYFGLEELPVHVPLTSWFVSLCCR